MPASGDEWLQASTEWASKCCLESSSATHSFKIKNPHSKRMQQVQAAIKAWVEYDAQFYLGGGIFTLAPTNVFQAMNGVSPVATFSQEHEYCKMVIKKKWPMRDSLQVLCGRNFGNRMHIFRPFSTRRHLQLTSRV
jgi:hypothetical protein